MIFHLYIKTIFFIFQAQSRLPVVSFLVALFYLFIYLFTYLFVYLFTLRKVLRPWEGFCE